MGMSDTFQDLILAEIPRLRTLARGLSGSTTEADDLVQDAILRAWRFRETFLSGTNFQGWISTILRNVYFSQRSERSSWVEDVDGVYAGQVPAAPDQEWRLRFAEVLNALPRLPSDNRDALLLVAADGLSYQQAAEVAGCDVDVLRGRVRRARVQLADLTGVDVHKALRGKQAPEAPPLH